MTSAQKHLRNTFLAGIFAAIPVGVTVFLVWYVETATRAPLRKIFNGRFDIPFIGIPITLILIYLLGLGVTSIVGKWALRLADRLLLRMPLLKDLYQAWKQITVTPGGKEGCTRRSYSCPWPATRACSASPAASACQAITTRSASSSPIAQPVMAACISSRGKAQVLEMTAEEAFKFLLSSANYIPPQIGAATCAPRRNSRVRFRRASCTRARLSAVPRAVAGQLVSPG
jgi:uncharacterized membrane protein